MGKWALQVGRGHMVIPKLKDIAAATGMHAMTVSRALRNVGRMRPETRQRVLEAARTMGYRPNAAASAMRTGHTGCIAMISSPHLHVSYFTPNVMEVIIAAVANHGGYLAHATIPSDVDVSDTTTLPRLLSRHMAEGVLLNYTHDAFPHFDDFLQRNGLPAVWMNHKRRTNAVYPDDFGAARKVTEQLIALGHKRIAFVRLVRESDMYRNEEHYSVTDRLAGYKAAMQQAGLRPDELVFSHHWDQWNESIESRLQPLAKIFCDPARRPTAVIIYRYGPVLMGLLQKLGVQAPEDVSVVSFTGYAAHAVEQMLSWVPVPGETMGAHAVEMIFQMIETGKKELPSISLPYGEIASMHTVRRVG